VHLEQRLLHRRGLRSGRRIDLFYPRGGLSMLEPHAPQGLSLHEELRGADRVLHAATVQAVLTVGGAALSVTGLSTATGEEDWIQVTFNGEANLAFHGHILFTTNPNSEFVFDIASDCMGTLRSCGEGGSCQAKTEWEEAYITTTPAPSPTGTTWAPIPTIGVTYIRVYRASATAAPTCDAWVLAISE
jgi:hypothetical protein